MQPRTPLLLVLLAAGVLATAGSAGALYLVTPLQLTPSSHTGEVGDAIEFRIDAGNDTEARAWAGQKVVVHYAYDPHERADEGRADEDPGQPAYRRVRIADLTLDGKAHGTFAWTLPAELDGHNLDVLVETPEGELLAVNHLAVGDAPPAMRILAGSGPAQPPAQETAGGADAAPEAGRDDVPGLGIAAVVGTIGALAAFGALAGRRRG